MAIENVELMHECFPEHLRMGTVRINKTNTQREKVRREERTWKDVRHKKNKSRLRKCS